MRISNRSLQDRVLRDLQSNMVQLARAQEQVSTGKRITRMSQDPVAGTDVLRAERDLRALAQYRRNITAARTRVDTQESALDQAGDILVRARELAVTEASSSASAQTRNAVAAEIDTLIQQLVALGNTRIGEDFIFGGTATTAPPFQPDGTYVGDAGIRQAEIGDGVLMPTAHTGQQAFGDTGAIASLTQLRDRLRANDQAGVGATIASLEAAFTAVQVVVAETGARSRQLEVAGQNVEAMDLNATLLRSDAQDIPLEEAVLHMAGIQNALQAALLSASRILNTSLTDYLR